jgi:hypothetical protein
MGMGASCVVGHDGEELLLVDLAVLVHVELVDHGLSERSELAAPGVTGGVCNSQLIVLQPVANLLRYPAQVAEANLARVVVVEQLERTADLLHRVAREYALAHWTLLVRARRRVQRESTH